MLNRIHQTVVFLVCVAFLSSAGLRAEESGGEGEGKKHGKCREEIQKLCPDIEKGPELAKCVDEHADKLSAECKEHHAKRKEKHEEILKLRESVKEACKSDQEKFCKDKEIGEGLMKCMKEHEKELSEGCQSAIDKLKEERPKGKRRDGKGKKARKE